MVKLEACHALAGPVTHTIDPIGYKPPVSTGGLLRLVFAPSLPRCGNDSYLFASRVALGPDCSLPDEKKGTAEMFASRPTVVRRFTKLRSTPDKSDMCHRLVTRESCLRRSRVSQRFSEAFRPSSLQENVCALLCTRSGRRGPVLSVLLVGRTAEVNSPFPSKPRFLFLLVTHPTRLCLQRRNSDGPHRQEGQGE